MAWEGGGLGPVFRRQGVPASMGFAAMQTLLRN
jgi:hypothetical protein